jgi:hypothetical protein
LIRADWFFLALLLGLGGAAAGVNTFEGGRFKAGWFVVIIAAAVVSALPFILGRYLTFGIWGTVVAVVGYLVLHAVSGLLLGAFVVAVWVRPSADTH